MEVSEAQMLVTEVECAKCECCGLEEECTEEYIGRVKADFGGRWLCGLCAEAVREEAGKGRRKEGLEEAVKAHMSFCRRSLQSNPAIHVVDGMRQCCGGGRRTCRRRPRVRRAQGKRSASFLR